MWYEDWPGDFNSDDLERYNAHQRAKGRQTIASPDVLKRLRENYDAVKDAKSESRYEENPQAEPELGELRGDTAWWNGAEE
jgi:hypothetical protein